MTPPEPKLLEMKEIAAVFTILWCINMFMSWFTGDEAESQFYFTIAAIHFVWFRVESLKARNETPKTLAL